MTGIPAIKYNGDTHYHFFSSRPTWRRVSPDITFVCLCLSPPSFCCFKFSCVFVSLPSTSLSLAGSLLLWLSFPLQDGKNSGYLSRYRTWGMPVIGHRAFPIEDSGYLSRYKTGKIATIFYRECPMSYNGHTPCPITGKIATTFYQKYLLSRSFTIVNIIHR